MRAAHRCAPAPPSSSPGCRSSPTGRPMAHPEIVVIGAGPAGMRAALTLAEAGLRRIVIDEAPQPGGQIFRSAPPTIHRQPRDVYGFDAGRAVALKGAFAGLADRIEYRPGTLVWGVEGD